MRGTINIWKSYPHEYRIIQELEHSKMENIFFYEIANARINGILPYKSTNIYLVGSSLLVEVSKSTARQNKDKLVCCINNKFILRIDIPEYANDIKHFKNGDYSKINEMKKEYRPTTLPDCIINNYEIIDKVYNLLKKTLDIDECLSKPHFSHPEWVQTLQKRIWNS